MKHLPVSHPRYIASVYPPATPATPATWSEVAWTLWALDPFSYTANHDQMAVCAFLATLESHVNRLGVVVEVRS